MKCESQRAQLFIVSFLFLLRQLSIIATTQSILACVKFFMWREFEAENCAADVADFGPQIDQWELVMRWGGTPIWA